MNKTNSQNMSRHKIHKKKLQALQTRQAILAGATKCFAKNGYSGASLDAIAVASGITKGAVYNHFRSKAALFMAIIEWAYSSATKTAADLKAALPMVDAVLALLRAVCQDNEFPIDHRLWAEILAVANRDGDVRAVFIKCQTALRDILEGWIREGIQNGEIRPDVDPLGATRMLFALGNGLLVRLDSGANLGAGHCFIIVEEIVRRYLQYGFGGDGRPNLEHI